MLKGKRGVAAEPRHGRASRGNRRRGGCGRAAARTSYEQEQAPGGCDRAAARTSCVREQLPGGAAEPRHGGAARGNSCRGGYGWRRADVMIILEC